MAFWSKDPLKEYVKNLEDDSNKIFANLVKVRDVLTQVRADAEQHLSFIQKAVQKMGRVKGDEEKLKKKLETFEGYLGDQLDETRINSIAQLEQFMTTAMTNLQTEIRSIGANSSDKTNLQTIADNIGVINDHLTQKVPRIVATLSSYADYRKQLVMLGATAAAASQASSGGAPVEKEAAKGSPLDRLISALKR